MRRIAPLALMLVLAGCSGEEAAPPAEPPEPVDPAKIVGSSYVAPLNLEPGESTEVRIPVRIAEGFHVQANPAADAFLIPLELFLADIPGVVIGEPVYPPGRPYRLQGADRDLSVYSGTIEVRVPVQLAPGATFRSMEVGGTLRYQACDARRCLAPAAAPVSFTVKNLR